jgi:hypothetical protein
MIGVQRSNSDLPRAQSVRHPAGGGANVRLAVIREPFGGCAVRLGTHRAGNATPALQDRRSVRRRAGARAVAETLASATGQDPQRALRRVIILNLLAFILSEQ